MKNQGVLIVVLSIAAAVAGCKKNESSSEYSTDTNSYGISTNDLGSTSPTQQLQNAAENGSNAWQNASNASVNAWTDVKQGTSNAWSKTKEATTNAWGDVKNTFQSKGATNENGSTNYDNGMTNDNGSTNN